MPERASLWMVYLNEMKLDSLTGYPICPTASWSSFAAARAFLQSSRYLA
jgi:hypothetical protein